MLSLGMITDIESHLSVYTSQVLFGTQNEPCLSLSLFFFFFWPHTMWLVGFLFPDQGLNLDGKVLTSGLPGNFPR